MKKTASPPAIEILEATKTFDRGLVTAVRDVSLAVGRGEIFGLIGPNGAGKTTLLKLAAGLLKPEAGRVRLAGIDLAEEPLKARRLLGYAAAEPLLCERMTGRQYLSFIAHAFSLDKGAARRADELAEEFELRAHLRQPIGQYLPGQRQKLSLVSVFLHDPSVLVLDEPWAHLDPRSVSALRRRLEERAARGAAVLFSTYFLDLAPKVADRLGILRRGSLAAAGSFVNLKKQSGRKGATLEDLLLEYAP